MEAETQGKENPSIMKVPSSPNFLKPKAISLRKKEARLKPNLPLVEVDLNKNDNIPYLLKSSKIARNPFRRNECKRKRDAESMDEDSNSLLWKHVNRSPEDINIVMRNLPSPVVPSLLDESALSAFSDSSFDSINLKIEKTPVTPIIKVLPVDWSLKTKIRFTSPTPFPIRSSFRTFEEVNGTIGFVRCLHSDETEKSDVNSSHGAKVFEAHLVWMFPFLPWLNLFPRDGGRVGNGLSLVNPAMEDSLHSAWCVAFLSLFHLVRLYQCPYFYMCTPTFTVLFRCAGAASIPVMHALISPTTKGFRKALREADITFKMPLCQNKEPDLSLEETTDEDLSSLSPPTSSDKENESDERVEDEEPESWLESLGVSQDDFISKKKRRKDPAHHIDHKAESLVYIEDVQACQTLVDFLMNSNFCTSKIGPMAGVPPTLLAPRAFVNGTLQTEQLRHGKVKKGDEEYHSLEISGPLLPNSVHLLCTLFSTTQEKGFSAALTSRAPTTSFCQVNPQSPMLPCIFAKNNMTDCKLSQPFLQEMCSTSDKTPLNTIVLENGFFKCN